MLSDPLFGHEHTGRKVVREYIPERFIAQIYFLESWIRAPAYDVKGLMK